MFSPCKLFDILQLCMQILKHAPPPQSDVAETWSWKPYGRHHAPCTWPHPHTRYDDTQQVLTTTHSPGCCPRSHRTFRCMIPKLQMRAKTMLLVDIHLTSRGTWTPKPSHNPLFSFQSRNREMYYVWSHQQLLFRFLSFFLWVVSIHTVTLGAFSKHVIKAFELCLIAIN